MALKLPHTGLISASLLSRRRFCCPWWQVQLSVSRPNVKDFETPVVGEWAVASDQSAGMTLQLFRLIATIAMDSYFGQLS
jgi:hypothetical protein